MGSMDLEMFGGLKGSFINLLNDVEAISNHYSSDIPVSEEFKNLISTTISELSSSMFIVAVVGVIKRGKSTLLNALLETDSDILSVKVTPETARLAYLIYSEEPFAVIHHLDGKQTKIPFDELPDYTSSFNVISPRGKKEKVLNTKFAEIHYPNDYLKQGIILVDTPGVDDPEPARSKITEDFISDADAVIFMVDATEGGLKASELGFMMKRIINNKDKSKGIICVVNKINALRRHQRGQLQDVINKTSEVLKNKLGIEIPIYSIDALDALDGKRNRDETRYEKSQFQEFKGAIEKYLIQEKGTIKMKRLLSLFHYGCLANLIERIQFDISIKPDNLLNLEKQLNESETNLTQFKAKFESFKRKLHTSENSLKVWIERETKDEFSHQVIVNEQRYDSVPSSIVRTVSALKDRFALKVQQSFIELENDLNTSQIKIPQVVFDVKSPQVSLERYLTKERITVKKNEGASFWGGLFGAALGLFTAGILAPVGAYIGYKFGKSIEGQEETNERTVINIEGMIKEVNAITRSTEDSFKKQVELYYQAFHGSVISWFDSQEVTIKQKRSLISNSKNSAESSFNERRIRLEDYLKTVKLLEDRLSSINKQLEIHNVS